MGLESCEGCDGGKDGEDENGKREAASGFPLTLGFAEGAAVHASPLSIAARISRKARMISSDTPWYSIASMVPRAS